MEKFKAVQGSEIRELLSVRQFYHDGEELICLEGNSMIFFAKSKQKMIS